MGRRRRPPRPRGSSTASSNARRLGGWPADRAGEVRFLGRVDGDLTADRETVSAVARVIRELRPEVVLGHDPWKRYRLHPDHRAAGLLVCDGIVAARDPHFFPEHGIAHHRPSALLLWEADEPNHIEDVTRHASPPSSTRSKPTRASSRRRCTPATPASSTPSDAGSAARLAELGAPFEVEAGEIFRLMTDL